MAEHDPMIGRVLHGTIEIKRRIGAGGMGYVYEGYQEHLDRRVAVKVMTPEHARNPIAAEYFIREARSSSRLRHPHIIQIIDFGKEDDETLFIAMEFIPGKPLSDILKAEFPLPVARVLSIMDQTLDALHEAHARDVIHRDLKPDNLMIEKTRDGKDFVKVLDFGIAQLKNQDQKAGPLTQVGALVGTPSYMSPEQARSGKVDARSDLFSMGSILYELLTNALPFKGRTIPETLVAVMRDEPLAPSAVRSDLALDPALEAICLRALQKDPELRYQSAQEFRQALSKVANGPAAATEAPPARFIFKRSTRRPGDEEPTSPSEQAPVEQAPAARGPEPEEAGPAGHHPSGHHPSGSYASVLQPPAPEHDAPRPPSGHGGFGPIRSHVSTPMPRSNAPINLASGSATPASFSSISPPLPGPQPPGSGSGGYPWARRPSGSHTSASLAPGGYPSQGSESGGYPRARRPSGPHTPASPTPATGAPLPNDPSHLPTGDARPHVPTNLPTNASYYYNSTAELHSLDLEALRQDLVGQKRFATVLVAHQRIQGTIDAEDLAEAYVEFDQIFHDIARQWGGVIHSRNRGFTTIIFGLPTMRADDGVRAAYAALALRARLVPVTPPRMTFAFSLVNGSVFCPSERVQSAAGEALDHGLEVVEATPPGEVLVAGLDFQAQLERTFRLGSPKDQGVRAVLEVLDLEQAPEVSTRGLIGRESETASLLAALAELGRQQGSFLAITGEAGTGKSALVRQLIDLANQRQFVTLVARQRHNSAENLRDLQRQWVFDLMRRAGHTPASLQNALVELGLASDYARVLHALVNTSSHGVHGVRSTARSLDGDADASHVVRAAIRALCRVLSQDRPLVVVLDGVDEVSPMLADYLASWSGFVGEAPVLFVVATRTYPGRPRPALPPQVTTIDLAPLSAAAARVLLKVQLPRTVDDAHLERLVRLCSGLPLHIEQLARYITQNPDASIDEAERKLGKVRGVRDILRIRLYDQPRSVQNLLALLAVIGERAQLPMVYALAPAAWEPDASLQRLHDEGLLGIEEGEPPRLFFTPASFRHVIYEEMSQKNRERAHHRVAAYLEAQLQGVEVANVTPEEFLALAHHRNASGNVAGALDLLEQLIDRAIEHLEYESALGLLKQALEYCRSGAEIDPTREAVLKLHYARVLHAQGRTHEALDIAVAIDRTPGLPLQLVLESRLEKVMFWLEEEDPQAIDQVLRNTIDELERARTGGQLDEQTAACLHLRALHLHAHTQEKLNHLGAAADILIEAIELARQRGIHAANNPWGPALVWEPLNQLGRIRMKLDQFDGARTLFETALRASVEAGDVRGELVAHANLSALHAAGGHFDKAQLMLAAAIKIARRCGNLRAVAKLQHNRGLLLTRQQYYDLAHQAFTLSSEMARDLDWREGIAMNARQLASLDQIAVTR